jgi:D-alanine-D-alanine ligase
MGIPYTGCPTEAIVAVTSKVAVKERLLAAGLPTPPWLDLDRRFCLPQAISAKSDGGTTRFILKSVYEHASFHIEDASLVAPDNSEAVTTLVCECTKQSGRAFFAEQFIDGREFNLSLWGAEPELLPPAEIDFSTFPAGKPRIVGHRAKWNPASFEYDQTARRFEFPAADRTLLLQLKKLAIDCWRLFGLDGYARIDFRIDAAGQPWILEINANPS